MSPATRTSSASRRAGPTKSRRNTSSSSTISPTRSTSPDLRAVFHNPDELRSGRTRAKLTKEAADKFQTISDSLQHRNPDREAVAHFVNQLVFCFFADSVKLLPERRCGRSCCRPPSASREQAQGLSRPPVRRHGEGRRLRSREHSRIQRRAVRRSWPPLALAAYRDRPPVRRREPRLEPDRPDDLRHVVRALSRSRQARADRRALHRSRKDHDDRRTGRAASAARRMGDGEGEDRGDHGASARSGGRRRQGRERASSASASTPRAPRRKPSATPSSTGSAACAFSTRPAARAISSISRLQGVKDIEWRAILDCETLGLGMAVPRVGPEILHGIEINPFAAELARTTIWIGDIQWRVKNAIHHHPRPVLRKLDSIECRDALLTPDGKGGFVEAEWPEADFIIGNPPFLGGKLMRRGLGDATVETLFRVYDGRVPAEADLVCYWFAKAWEAIAGEAARSASVSSRPIPSAAARTERSWSRSPRRARFSRRGATSRGRSTAQPCEYRLVCFGRVRRGDASESMRPIGRIHSDLSGEAIELRESASDSREQWRLPSWGDTKGGAFDIPRNAGARDWLTMPLNPQWTTERRCSAAVGERDRRVASIGETCGSSISVGQ